MSFNLFEKPSKNRLSFKSLDLNKKKQKDFNNLIWGKEKPTSQEWKKYGLEEKFTQNVLIFVLYGLLAQSMIIIRQSLQFHKHHPFALLQRHHIRKSRAIFQCLQQNKSFLYALAWVYCIKYNSYSKK